MAYIRRLRAAHTGFWLPAVAAIIAAIVASHLARRERPKTLGFRAGNFGECVRRFGPALAGLVAAMWSAGMLSGSIRPLGFGQAAQSFAVYPPWGLLQQYLLNGYVAHTPNWLPMVVTAVTAVAAIRVLPKIPERLFPGTGACSDRLLAFHGRAGFREPSPAGGAGMVLVASLGIRFIDPLTYFRYRSVESHAGWAEGIGWSSSE